MDLLVKVLVVAFLLAILYTLFSSLLFMLRDRGRGERMVRRLSWRIGLSLVFILCLYLAAQLGWIEPRSQ